MESEISKIINRLDFKKITEHPNILIAASFWEEDRYHAAHACYRFMRMIDDMIDHRKINEGTIQCFEKQLFVDKVKQYIECLDLADNQDPYISQLVRTIRTYKIPLRLFHIFARSMIHDIKHDGFTDMEEFMNYCEGASVAPASVFVHLCCLKRINGTFIEPPFDIFDTARSCAIFSYIVHIIRDFQKDQQNNLNYFPSEYLTRFKLKPSDLKEIADGAAIPGSFRDMIAEYCRLAEQYREEALDQLEGLTALVGPRYLLSLYVIYNLYLQVYERIDIKDGKFTSRELNPTHEEIRMCVYRVLNEKRSLLTQAPL